MKNLSSKIIIHQFKCTGCRACEMACSFHHVKFFSRKFSSIIVSRNEKDRKMKVIIQKSDKTGREICDDCYNEIEPLCVKYCTKKALEVVNI